MSYTTFAEQKLYNNPSQDEQEQIEQTIDFIKQPNFRPFNEGLTELIIRAGYNASKEDIESKADFLNAKLKQIGSKIKADAVYSWFSGASRPKIQPASRIKMYEICFSLNLSKKDTEWFFQHVYFDRCFNCHTIGEGVFYYCFKNGLTYKDAQSLIDEINQQTNNTPTVLNNTSNYTRLIADSISSFSKTEDFVRFMVDNKPSFNSWNKSAYDTISKQLTELTGSNKSAIQSLKQNLKKQINSPSNTSHLNEVDPSLFTEYGLLLREIYHDAKEDPSGEVTRYIWETIDNIDPLANSFVLNRLLSTDSGIKREAKIPEVVKVNFPSKKSLSDILGQRENGKNKIETSESYDMIRKILVLFHFFTFWLKVKLKDSDTDEYNHEQLFDIYREEADYCLHDCGYEPLYAGNPYDWIFLRAAYNEKPLTFFRACINEIIED